MKRIALLIMLFGLIIQIGSQMAQAESLFMLNASQTQYIEPRPLYGTIRARNVGDLVTIIINETPNTSDKGIYETQKTSSLAENLTNTINTVFSKDLKSIDGTKGAINVKGNTATQRQMAFHDRVAVQVVQVLPNGNLLVQGKKSLVNINERVDMLISGIVDPRWLNQIGEIDSRKVANLQFAMNGAGTVSRGQNEGIINKFIRMVF